MAMNAPHDEIQQVAYRLWQERGAPIGSPEVDWERAEQEVSARAIQGAQASSAGAQFQGAERENAPSGGAAAGAAAKGRRRQRAEHNS